MKRKIILVFSVILTAIIALLGFRLIFPDISPLNLQSQTAGTGGGPGEASLNNDGSGDLPDLPAIEGDGEGTPGLPDGGISMSPSPTSDGTVSSQMSVQADVPLFTVSGSVHTEYLRVTALETYQDGYWRIPDSNELKQYRGEEIDTPPVKSGAGVEDRITVKPLVAFSAGFFPTALYTTKLNIDVPVVYYPGLYSFESQSSFSTPYSLSATGFFPEVSDLENTGVETNEIHLQLPGEITERTRELAAQITEGLDTPYAKAKAIETYLRTGYRYSQEFAPAPPGEEPVDWFLFTEKQGICGNFNTAFVVLARCAEIPARLVSGFVVTAQEEEQVVSARQAHAWAEVPFTDYGWITFDATPPGNVPMITDDVRKGGIITFTEITGVITPDNAGAKKGHTFTVTGKVTLDGVSQPVRGVAVEIYVNRIKEEGGKLVGAGTVPADSRTGEFSIECEIDNEVQVGSYQLIAHAIGNEKYAESWSDPELKILSDTRITLDIQEEARVNGPFDIQGTLEEELGNPVAGMPVLVTVSDGTEPRTFMTGSDGVFSLSYVFMKPGEYTVSASFEGTDYYLASDNRETVTVMMPTVLTFDMPGEAFPDELVPVSGKLVNVNGVPLSGKEIALSIDGNPVRKEITGTGGEFSFTHAFSDSGWHTVEAGFERQDFSLESTAADKINIIDIVIDVDTPDVFLRGQSVRISGNVVTEKGPLSGKTLALLFDGSTLADITTGSSGEFEYLYNVGENAPTGPHTLSYYLAEYDRTRTQDVFIKAGTSLTMTAPGEIEPGGLLTVIATLLDDKGSPLQGMSLVGGDYHVHGPTDDNGQLSIFREIPEGTIDKEVILFMVFEETEQYLSSSAGVRVEIVRTGSIPLWILLVISGVLIAAISGYYYLIIVRRKRGRPAGSEPEQEIHFEETSKITGKSVTGISILFPQITLRFPDVWGYGENLEIQAVLHGENAKPLEGKEVSVRIENDATGFETNTEGMVSLNHVFAEKGVYTIECAFSGDDDCLPSGAVRTITIVDYREEIVSLYSSLVGWATSKGVQLPVDATPRFLESRLVKELNGIDEKALDSFLWHFEEADYSTHSTGREQYEKAYLALAAVRGSIGEKSEPGD